MGIDKKEEIRDRITKLMEGWDRGNFTVCPSCNMDDFCHFEGCEYSYGDDIIARLTNFCFGIQKENKR